MEVKQTVKSKIRKGDTVKVISGNNRGQIGKVFRCNGEKIFVQGINKAKKHVRKQGRMPGQIIERERPIHVSNLRVCIEEDKPVKLKVRVSPKGTRELVYKSGKSWASYRVLGKKKD